MYRQGSMYKPERINAASRHPDVGFLLTSPPGTTTRAAPCAFKHSVLTLCFVQRSNSLADSPALHFFDTLDCASVSDLPTLIVIPVDNLTRSGTFATTDADTPHSSITFIAVDRDPRQESSWTCSKISYLIVVAVSNLVVASSIMSSGPVASGTTSGSCSGGCFSENSLKYQYLQGYFTAHMLPASSYRYVYLLWFVTIAVCLVLGTFHMLGIGDRSYIGAKWKRWATKNRVYKTGKRVDIYGNRIAKDINGTSRMFAPPKQRRIFSFPSFGRLVLLFFMIAVPIVLTLVGADFIGPNVGVFDFSQSWPSQTTNTVGLSRRMVQTLHKRLQWGQGSYPSVTTYPPSRTLPYRTWWTTGDRTGDITMGLVPIVLVMALKQVPFALLSTRFFGGYAFDRLSFLHKWGGRIIWLFGTAHLITWCIQLNKDTRIGEPVWSFVFMWTKFRWGWVSYGFLTAMTVLSIGPIRKNFYEWFYVVHVVTVAGFIITAMLHHPPLAQWMYIPLAWWAADRLSRALKVAWINGLGFAGRKPQFALAPKVQPPSQHQYEKSGADSFQHHRMPTSYSQHGMESSTRGHGTVASSISSHKYPMPSSMSSEYEPTLVGSMKDAHTHRHKLSASPDDLPLQQHPHQSSHHLSQFSADVDHPLTHRHEASSPGASTGIERRATRLSARYDPVNELISEYIPSRRSTADIYPPPPQEPLPPLPSEYASVNGPIKYALEDPGPANEPPAQSFQLSPQPSPLYPPVRPGRDPSHFSVMTGRPSTMFSTVTGSVPRSLRPRPAMSADVAAVIRPGYAFVQLLPGKTLRLTLRTPNRMSWKPGQWVYLNVPAVRFWESHPFTIASAHDAEFPVSTEFVDVDTEKGLTTQGPKVKGEERTMVLLVRCRKGFTRHLWNFVAKRRQQQIEAAADAQFEAGRAGLRGGSMVPMLGKDTTGVHIRAIVDGPYGSADRTHWGIHSSIVIICGGSGVSFGMSVLEHLCACIVGAERLGKQGKGGKNFLTRRIRFVWIMREFSHLQWVASALRRCVEMVPPEQLQVELFVTHFNHQSALPPARYGDDAMFAPPNAPFVSAGPGERNSWMSTMEPGTPGAEGLTPRAARFTEGPEQDEYDVTAFDLTHFEGEDTSAPTAMEEEMNKRIRSEGKLRRANTRRATMKRKGGRNARGAHYNNITVNSDASREVQTLESQRAMYEGKINVGTHSADPAPGSIPAQRDDFDYTWQRAATVSTMPDGEEVDLADSRTAMHDQYPLRPSPRDRSPGRAPVNSRMRSESNARPSRSSPPNSAGAGGLAVPFSATSSSFGGPAGLSGFVSPDPSRPGTPRTLRGHSYGPSGASTPYGDGGEFDPDLEALKSPSHAAFYGSEQAPTPGPSSTLNLLNTSVPAIPSPKSPLEDAPIDLDAEEDIDLRVVAELAKPGHPKLDRIIRQEVGQSQGRTLVAACGPRSLDILLRSVVSKVIDPVKVRRGDLTGIVNIASETFEWGG
ncbi:hypothetical protein BCV70DRAFT_230410 [Testicularia cyperi]|uniref:ferric-chelate reductase (NADPH) n=1 Tax=Testicularia cyperi TaxID=1882483 RepID=A0A317XYB3_9BASI|nr:hypothetical protein BCV70DRAFT_230410 [Testicularia cyperi]